MTIGRVLCAAIVGMLLFGALSVSYAGMLSYDIAYWYWSDPEHISVATMFNEKPADLNSIVLVVHQVVYDAESSRAKLIQNKEDISAFDTTPLYLYSYSVFNISWLEDTGAGLMEFAVNWNSPCEIVTKADNMMMQDWNASENGGSLKWTWTGDNTGLCAGGGASGFWAVNRSSECGPTSASAKSSDNVTINGEVIALNAVPEPSGLVALLVGIIGLSQHKLLRRR